LEFIKSEYNIDMIDNYNNFKHMYFAADHTYLQAWAPVGSAEARLVVSKNNLSKYKNYDYKKWENQFAYFSLMRSFGYFDIFMNELQKHNTQYDGCFDCMLEISILISYIHNYNGKKIDLMNISKDKLKKLLDNKTIKELIKLRGEMDDILFYPFDQKCPFHGHLNEPPKNLQLKMK